MLRFLCRLGTAVAMLAIALPWCAGAEPVLQVTQNQTLLSNEHLRIRVSDGALRSINDAKTGETLFAWPPQTACWYAEVGTDRLDPERPARVEVARGKGSVALTLASSTPAPNRVEATTRLVLADDPWIDLSIEVVNRGQREVELVGFPANASWTKGPDRYFVYPYNSGVLLPLDERFARILIYGLFPFIRGYPSNLCSMQWMGMYGPQGGVMLMGTDRYGWLKRMGARDAGDSAQIVCEAQASLPPGGRLTAPPWRVVALPGGDYRQMARVYRSWVRERTSPDAGVARDSVDPIEKTPLQFVSFAEKLRARPHLRTVMGTHGYPEHAIRSTPDGTPFAYMPYGMTLSLMEAFSALYKGTVTPQMWSPFVTAASGWRKFPHSTVPEERLIVDRTTFPGILLEHFLRTTAERDTPVFLYVNPSFWAGGSPDFDLAKMMDKDADGLGDTVGGFEAGATNKPYYVNPFLVRDYLLSQVERLAAFGDDAAARATGLMFDSSQVFGATLWANSRLRRDRLSCIDRNPAARYVERYGYLGRDSAVQDKLGSYLALHEATPHAAKVGEWIGEFETLFLDMNAGSVDLKREFPDAVARPASDSPIPVPLYQMVYGDSQLFAARVGAASDANMGGPDPEQMIPAEVTRRGSAMFGAVHQALFWGGVRWAGPAYNRLRPRTWMIVRDNAVRKPLFGRRAQFRMLTPQGRPTTDMFCVRETTWLDDSGTPVAVHWDNNSGRAARATALCGSQRVQVEPMWGQDAFVPSSLDRLRPGATATITTDGRFALWSFAGTISVGPGPLLTIKDSQPTPEGLAVIWDGTYLSISNENPRERTVKMRLRLTEGTLAPLAPAQPLGPDGRPIPGAAPITYNMASNWSADRQGDYLDVEATLPGARPLPDDRPPAVPACMIALELFHGRGRAFRKEGP